jgi:hypothetical protein
MDVNESDSSSPECCRKHVHDGGVAVVSGDDEVVDSVEEDVAKMTDTFSVLGTAPSGGDEWMEQRQHRASRPTFPKWCTTMSTR